MCFLTTTNKQTKKPAKYMNETKKKKRSEKDIKINHKTKYDDDQLNKKVYFYLYILILCILVYISGFLSAAMCFFFILRVYILYLYFFPFWWSEERKKIEKKEWVYFRFSLCFLPFCVRCWFLQAHKYEWFSIYFFLQSILFFD